MKHMNIVRIPKDEYLETEDARPPAFSDEALALRFTERHGSELRYVAAWSRWLSWDGKRWTFDDTLRAFDMARRICREAASECNKPKVSASSPAQRLLPPSSDWRRPTASTRRLWTVGLRPVAIEHAEWHC